MAKKILIVILVLFVSFFLSVSCKLYALDDSSYPPRKGYCIMGGQVEGNLNRLSYEPASPVSFYICFFILLLLLMVAYAFHV